MRKIMNQQRDQQEADPGKYQVDPHMPQHID